MVVYTRCRFILVFTRIILLLLATPGCLSSSFAVPLSVSRLTLESGVSQSTVYAVVQDNQGYIWLGTADGIDIYDGYSFRHLRHDPDNPDSLSDNYVRSLLVDSDGQVWVGTLGGGLNRYNPKSGHWQHYRADGDTTTGLISDDVYSLYQDTSGDIWIGSEFGVSRLHISSGKLRHFWSEKLLVGGNIRAITQSQDGFIWFGSASQGISRFNPETEIFVRYQHEPAFAGSLSSNSVNVIYEDSQQRLWVGTEYGGLNLLDRERNTFRHWLKSQQGSGLNDSEVTAIHEDGEGQLWLGTWSGGLNRFNPQLNTFTHYLSSEANQASLSSNTILSLFEDSSGVLWAGTYDNGVNRIPYQGQDFIHYRYDPLLNTGLADKMIWAFSEDARNRIWIGTKKGLSRLDASDSTMPQELYRSPCNSILNTPDVRAIVATKDQLWLGTAGAGLIRLQPESCEAQYYTVAQGLSNNHARLLLLDAQGFLWIGTKSGLNRLHLDSGKIEQFNSDRDDPGALPHARIRALYQDDQGTIWIGTSGGLSRYDAFKNRFYSLTTKQGLSGNDVRSIYRDSQGVMWLATGSGLTRYDPLSGDMRVFREQDGLSNNTLYGILADGETLWLSSNNGLNRFNTHNFANHRFDISDGLQSNEFNFNAYLKTTKGYLVGGVNGFNFFQPSRFATLKTKPELNITLSVEQQDSNRLLAPTGSGLVKISDSDRSFGFDIAVLHYLNPVKNRYRYRLQGYDTDWQEANAAIKSQRYAGLPPGFYRFEIQAIASNGVSSGEPLVQPLQVLPSAWLSSWAIVGYLLLMGLLMWLVLWLKIAVYRRQEVRLKRIIDSNTRELDQQNKRLNEQAGTLQRLLRAQDDFYLRTAHELRTPLALIRAPAELIKAAAPAERQHSHIILQGVQRLQRLIEQMLSAAIDEKVHEPGMQTFDLRAYIQPVLEAYRLSAAEKGVELIAGTIPNAAITFDKGALGDILHNLIGNAIKYTPAGGTIDIVTECQQDKLVLIVSDTGIGIPEVEQQNIYQRYYRTAEAAAVAEEGCGIGLDTVLQRVKRCDGQIRLDSRAGEGCCFRVDLPCLSTADDTLVEDFIRGAGIVVEAVDENTERLLVIEDDPAMQNLLGGLVLTNYQVEFAATVAQGITLARDLLPDLILCDVMLPDGSGLEITQELKSDSQTRHIPIILLTALSDPASRISGLQNSADDYVVKPFSPDELKLRIASQIDNRRRQTEWCRNKFLFAADTHEQVSDSSIQAVDLQYIQTLEAETLSLLQAHNCTLDSLAGEMAQSARTLQRKINALFGCSYTEYVQSQQLKQARGFLLQGLSVKESAYQSGFSDPTHLNRLFKKHYSMTPGDYRKQNSTADSSRQTTT